MSISKEFKFHELLKFAFPSMIMMIFLSLYTIIDGFFVSRFVGTDALSAINIVYPVLSIFVAIAIMFSAGGSALVARKMGEGDIEEANKNFSLITIFALGVCILLDILLFIFLDKVVVLLGAKGDLIPLCKAYLGILLFFAPLSVLQMVFQNFFITASKPRLGLTLTIIAGLCNMIFDYIFIAVMGMGIVGAALATAMGYCIPSIGGLIFFLKNKKGLRFSMPKWDARMLMQSSANGSSEMVTNLSVSVTTFIFNILMMKFAGADGVAAITVILYCQFLMTALFLGFSIGVAPVISYHYGAANTAYLKKLNKMCWTFIIAASLLIFITSLSSAEFIAAAFSDKASGVYPLICRGMRIFSIAFIFAGINIFASSLFTALSDGKTSAIISFLRTFGFILLGILMMAKLFEIDGIWLSIPFAEAATAIVVTFILRAKKDIFEIK